jgi:hypothetical protein
VTQALLIGSQFQRHLSRIGTEHSTAVTCVAIHVADAADRVCPVCFPGQVAARRAAHRYGVAVARCLKTSRMTIARARDEMLQDHARTVGRESPPGRPNSTKAGAPTLLDAESGLLACSVAPRTAGVGATNHLRVQHPSVRSAMHKSAGTSPNEQVAPRAAGDGSSNCKQAQRE